MATLMCTADGVERAGEEREGGGRGRKEFGRTLGTEGFCEWMEIDRTVDFVCAHGFRSVSLQFSDDLLCFSLSVYAHLSRRLPQHCRLFVLADTQYGSCCVDDVAAKHLNADVIIHYGHACLSSTDRLPVLYIFAGYPLDVPIGCSQDVTRFFTSSLKEMVDGAADRTNVLFWEVEYDAEVSRWTNILKNECPTLEIAELHDVTYSVMANTPSPQSSSAPSLTSCHATSSRTEGVTRCGQCECGISSAKEEEKEKEEKEEVGSGREGNEEREKERGNHEELGVVSDGTTNLLGRRVRVTTRDALSSRDKGSMGSIYYIGNPESPFFVALALQFNFSQFTVYDPSAPDRGWHAHTAAANRVLNRRYYFIQKVRDAEVFGVLAGTLSLTRYLQTIQDVKRVIEEDGGKRAYTLAVGKLNPAKVANFQDIDVFVSVACPESTIRFMENSRDFLKPIVTPLEVTMGVTEREWTGEYAVEFGGTVESHTKYGEENGKEKGGEEEGGERERGEEEETYYSFLEGKMKLKAGKRPKDIEFSTSTDISISTQSRDLMRVEDSAASLRKREFWGLSPQIGETPVGKLVQGLSGIACEYEGEGVGAEGEREEKRERVEGEEGNLREIEKGEGEKEEKEKGGE